MSATSAHRLLRGALTLVVMVAATMFGATAAHAAAPRLKLTALAFANDTVDATGNYASNKLTWTVTNTDPEAGSIFGTVTMRMRSTVTGELVGHDLVARYAYQETCCGDGVYESGTPQESTYSFDLPVRAYSDADTAIWEVTKVTIGSQGTTTTVSGTRLQAFGYRFTARTLIDSSGPSADSISLSSPVRRPYFYVGNGAATVTYDFTVQDGQSGFWKGTIRLAGPGGASVTTAFTWERDEYSTGLRCGRVTGGQQDGIYMPCVLDVTVPADAATGNWRVAALVLRNNAGGTTTYKNPTAPSVTTTTNSTVRASDFAIEPNPVDNWRDSVMTDITMVVTDTRKGLSTVQLDLVGGCQQWGLPTTRADGRVAVKVMVYQQTAQCEVEGLAVIDGAGNVALYGSMYGAPDPDLTITRVPSTEPPTARSASLDPSSLPVSEVGQTSIKLTIDADVKVAPITGVSVYVYDANGEVVSQSGGGSSQAPDGTLTEWLYLPWWQDLPAGAYTVGFELSDAARNSTAWNMPDRSNSRTLPGGPVVLTLTAAG
ncbi:hypothetical protein [Micromonospora chalcea]|uniref:hypothetical protein n=1 Tax=Micromonospora chalcea TaxID=1874 RepID=UPI00157C47EB|nr:hypothetical protein [Micromonospora chalcea]